MGCFSGPEIVNDGLIFHYDMSNTAKSWKGKPTTNYAYNQNPRIDSTYAQWEPTTDATWTANHPGRLIVYNDNGNSITGYINSGVNSGNWTVTHHAYWVYDKELKKPVVIMRDLDGHWKAKNWNTQQSMTSMGLGAGDTYTISWLQWTTNIAKSANAGLYGQNTSGQNGFHDGQSNAQTSTAYNTKPYTWQRVYATFTVNAVRNMGATLSCYMYGYFGGRGVVKISDVQIEPGSVSGFSKTQTRSNTEALLDLSSQGNTITTPALTYNSDGTFSFDNDLLYSGLYSGRNVATDPITIAAWVKSNVTTGNVMWLDCEGNGTNQRLYSSLITVADSNKFGVQSSTWGNGVCAHTNWSYQTIVLDGSTARGYENASEALSKAYTSYTLPGRITFGGRPSYYWDGEIAAAQIYSRALTPTEIAQNFENTRGKYGV